MDLKIWVRFFFFIHLVTIYFDDYHKLSVGIPSNEIFAHNTIFMNDDDEDADRSGQDDANEDDEDVIILHIDIREPIKHLRTLLEQRIGINLGKYEFWLQDAQAVSVALAKKKLPTFLIL